MFNWLLGVKPTIDKTDRSVSVAESITAGALCNALCAESGASSFFKGGIVAYSVASKKELLNVDTDYAENNNHANAFTTLEMAKSVASKFKSRYGLATTGYSSPFKREANPEKNECALDIQIPYAYICLYDSALNKEILIKEEYPFDPHSNKEHQRAMVQVKAAMKATDLYFKYLADLK